MVRFSGKVSEYPGLPWVAITENLSVFYVNFNKKFYQAAQYCYELKSKLYEPRDKDELKAVSEYVESEGGSVNYWIGVHDSYKENR